MVKKAIMNLNYLGVLFQDGDGNHWGTLWVAREFSRNSVALVSVHFPACSSLNESFSPHKLRPMIKCWTVMAPSLPCNCPIYLVFQTPRKELKFPLTAGLVCITTHAITLIVTASTQITATLHRIFKVGRNLLRSPSLAPLFQESHLQHAAQDHAQLAFVYLYG